MLAELSLWKSSKLRQSEHSTIEQKRNTKSSFPQWMPISKTILSLSLWLCPTLPLFLSFHFYLSSCDHTSSTFLFSYLWILFKYNCENQMFVNISMFPTSDFINKDSSYNFLIPQMPAVSLRKKNEEKRTSFLLTFNS